MSVPPDSSGPAGTSLPSEEARMRRALGLLDDGSPAREPAAPAPAPRPAPETRLSGGAPLIQRRDGDRRPRRFVRDGEVPVVVVNGSHRDHGLEPSAPTSRLAATETALAAERAARERAERALTEAQGTVQHLRTQAAHAELAQREALATARAAHDAAEAAAEHARAEAAAATDALAAARAERDALDAALAAERARIATLEAELAALRAAPPAPAETARLPVLTPASAARTDAEADGTAGISPKPKRAARRPAAATATKKAPVKKAPGTAEVATDTEPEPVKWWLPSYKAKLRARR